MPVLKLGQKLDSTVLKKIGSKLTSDSNYSLGGKLGSLAETSYQNSYTPVKGDQSFLKHGKYSEFEKTRQRKHYA